MAVIEKGSFEVISRSPNQTRRIGMRLGELLQPGDVISLVGNLGAGKTTFVQGVASGWGSLDPVSSPTYVLVNVYRRIDGNQLYHLDAFRLNDPQEAVDLDLDAMLDQSPLVVEWADRIQDVLPEGKLIFNMNYVAEEQRDFIIKARGDRHQHLLSLLKEEIYGASA